MFTTLIIDDEPLAHEVIKHHLQGVADFKLVAQCYNATQALSYLASHQVDLLLLDINMPALSGIDLLKVLNNRPQVIIISAYQQYAIQGFDLDVTDYLLKPVSAERLNEALDKVRRRLDFTNMGMSQSPSQAHYIVLKVDREKRKFMFSDISLLEAYGNYVKLWQGNSMTLVSSTLKFLLQQLPHQQFVQVHKSYIVNVDQVVAMDNEQLRLAEGQVVKIGKSFKESLHRLL